MAAKVVAIRFNGEKQSANKIRANLVFSLKNQYWCQMPPQCKSLHLVLIQENRWRFLLFTLLTILV